jgi:hypothetical protein
MVSVVGAAFYVAVFLFLVVAGIIGCGNPYEKNLLGRASYFLQVTLTKSFMSVRVFNGGIASYARAVVALLWPRGCHGTG